MLALLRGYVRFKKPPVFIIEVQGLGYEVHAPMSTFYTLPDDPAIEVTIHTQLVVRETAQTLYGFSSMAEKHVFKELIKINGIGPKVALTILSGLELPAVLEAVQGKRAAVFANLPGIGNKTAERLIVELQSRLKSLYSALHTEAVLSGHSVSVTAEHNNSTTALASTTVGKEREDAYEALLALGYKETEVLRALQQGNTGEYSNSAMMIRAALQYLGK
jgi:Holliday junction DNA helicase RuvA